MICLHILMSVFISMCWVCSLMLTYQMVARNSIRTCCSRSPSLAEFSATEASICYALVYIYTVHSYSLLSLGLGLFAECIDLYEYKCNGSLLLQIWLYCNLQYCLICSSRVTAWNYFHLCVIWNLPVIRFIAVNNAIMASACVRSACCKVYWFNCDVVVNERLAWTQHYFYAHVVIL